MMVALRLFSIIVFTTMLTGCPDFQERAIVRKLIAKNQECFAPGIRLDHPCHYLLKVINIREKTVTAQIPMEAVGPNQEGCEYLRDTEEVYPPQYPCPDARNHPAHEYVFQIEDPSTVQTSQCYHFVNELYFAKKGEPPPSGPGFLKVVESYSCRQSSSL
jgi:hypothetical protein